MARVRAKNTGPELALRHRLWAAGYRFRLHTRLPGKPDLVFPKYRTVVFVDGDFWHGRQWQLRGFKSLDDQMARVHGSEYWIAKLKRNVARDRWVDDQLRNLGWKVVRVWESDIATSVDAVASHVDAALREVSA